MRGVTGIASCWQRGLTTLRNLKDSRHTSVLPDGNCLTGDGNQFSSGVVSLRIALPLLVIACFALLPSPMVSIHLSRRIFVRYSFNEVLGIPVSAAHALTEMGFCRSLLAIAARSFNGSCPFFRPAACLSRDGSR